MPWAPWSTVGIIWSTCKWSIGMTTPTRWTRRHINLLKETQIAWKRDLCNPSVTRDDSWSLPLAARKQLWRQNGRRGPLHCQALKRNEKQKQRLGHHDGTGRVRVFWLSAALALVPPSDDSEPTSLPTPPGDVSWGIPTRNVFLMTEEPQQLWEGGEKKSLSNERGGTRKRRHCL